MNKAFWSGLSLVLLVAFASCDATKKTTGTPTVKKEKAAKEKGVKVPKEKGVKAPKPRKERRKKGGVADTMVVLVPPGSNAGQVIVAVPAGPLSEEALAGATLLAKRATEVPPFKTFSGKAKMRYETADDSKEFSAVIRIDSGKAIWVSVSALGGLVNVARLYLTPDSVKLVNYLQRQVTEKAYAESAALLPVALSFHDLEAFLLGYAPAEAAVGTVTQFAPIEGGVALTEHSNTTEWDYGLNYRSADSALTQFTALSGDAGKPFNLAVLLSEYALNAGYLFARQRVASWTTGEKAGKLFMDWEVPEWDKELAMPFSVPKSYERK